MPIDVLLVLIALLLFLVWQQAQEKRQRFAMPSGQHLRNGDLWELVRLQVQYNNVRGIRP